jgi:uncharacterized membrane protein YuzA (DUF378 family)
MKLQRFFILFAQCLILLGAFSIGIYGLYKVDIFQTLFPRSFIRTLQILIGISGLYLLIRHFI